MALNGAFITDHHCSCLSHCILGSNDQALLSPSFLIQKCTLQGCRLSCAIGLCIKIPSDRLTQGGALLALGSLSGDKMQWKGWHFSAHLGSVEGAWASCHKRMKLSQDVSVIWGWAPSSGPRVPDSVRGFFGCEVCFLNSNGWRREVCKGLLQTTLRAYFRDAESCCVTSN